MNDLIFQKIFDALESKLSKRGFFVILLIVLLLGIYYFAGVLPDIIIFMWLPSSILLIILLLINKSNKIGKQQHLEHSFNDHKYIITTNNDIDVEISSFEYSCRWNNMPITDIIITNKTDSELCNYAGFIDFYNAKNVCIERINFDATHIHPKTSFLIFHKETSLLHSSWSYASVSVYDEKSSLQTTFGKRTYHIYDLDYYLQGKSDLRWLKQKFREFWCFWKYKCRRKVFINSYRTTKEDQKNLLQDWIIKWLWRVLFAVTILAVSLLVSIMLIFTFRGVVHFININYSLLAKFFHNK